LIARPHSGRLRAGFALAASLAVPALCMAQTPAPAPPPNPVDPSKAAPPKVYSNPRSGPDDPRIGLKPGLYDAGEAIFGLQKVASMQKPPGFAPDPNAPEPPSQPAPPAGGWWPRRPWSHHQHRIDKLRPRLQRQPPLRRQLLRHQLLRHRQPGADQIGHFARLPRRTGRRLGLRPSALHVGRGL
jgi:hypothetical protein